MASKTRKRGKSNRRARDHEADREVSDLRAANLPSKPEVPAPRLTPAQIAGRRLTGQFIANQPPGQRQSRRAARAQLQQEELPICGPRSRRAEHRWYADPALQATRA